MLDNRERDANAEIKKLVRKFVREEIKAQAGEIIAIVRTALLASQVIESK